MRRRSAAALSAATLLLLSLAGCAANTSEKQVRTLTQTFFSYLREGASAKAATLVAGEGGAVQPLLRAAGEQPDLIPSFSIERIHLVDASTAQVFVTIPGSGTTTTIALVAHRSGKTWRFDSTIQVETRINPAIPAEGPPNEQNGPR